MNSRTHSLVLKAPREKVFRFLADVRNLPCWATEFCHGLEEQAGRFWVTTPMGRILFRIEADERTGVIDMHGGPSEEQMQVWPSRVVELPGGHSLFLFTAMQYPGVSDAEFAGQCDSLQREFEHIRAAVE
jgi:hypothetical protein